MSKSANSRRPDPSRSGVWAIPLAAAAGLLLSACAQAPDRPALPAVASLPLVNRLSWGATPADVRHVDAIGPAAYLEEQLRPNPAAALPPQAADQIASMRISQTPMAQLAMDLERERVAADAIVDDAAKKTAQQAYQQDLNRIAGEAAARSLLRDLYSPKQLQEQLTWFWLNHFSVHQYKSNLRVLVADYEDQIRAHALGRFRDLLQVTVHHPAMLRYLDNDQNAAGHINENYARELMELHTLGVDGGYNQHDVQELARILTGLGVSLSDKTPAVRPALAAQYRREGLFEYNPNRHDYGDKLFLGRKIQGRGLAEVDQVLDLLAAHPSTARHVCKDLAAYFLGAAPSGPLLDHLSRVYRSSDGRIDQVLRELLVSAEFKASLGHDFKDPVHYVVSAVRLAYDDKIILNPQPLTGWLNRMGEPLYGHSTPEGYALSAAAWSGPGQITDRFEIAKALGGGSAGLFRPPGAQPTERPAFPQLANSLYYTHWQALLSGPTRQALDQARSPQEWNIFFLSAPEFMYR